ncbi:hypothetical protein Mapa_013706 [Marchantia paleacea]|nr:hypothetical protein Mapa_013706 [Marchantia paleacea]
MPNSEISNQLRHNPDVQQRTMRISHVASRQIYLMSSSLFLDLSHALDRAACLELRYTCHPIRAGRPCKDPTDPGTDIRNTQQKLT